MEIGKPKYGPPKWVKAEDYRKLQAELDGQRDGEWQEILLLQKRIRELEAEVDRLRKENKTLKGILKAELLDDKRGG